MKVAKLSLHQKRIKTLTKNYRNLHSEGVFESNRLQVLEQQLLNHLYALSDIKIDIETDIEGNDLLPENALIAAIYNVAEPWDYVLTLLESDKTTADTLMPFVSMFLADKPVQLLENLEYVRFKPCERIQLVQHCLNTQMQCDLKAFRQSALVGNFKPDAATASILFGQANLGQSELQNGYAHSDINIAKAALVMGFVKQVQGWQKGFFQRFVKCDKADDKAELLCLAGLSYNPDWHEACKTFCINHPQYCTYVLSHYQDKQQLKLIIELMAQETTAKYAYQAWLNITAKTLYMTKASLPNCNQAELFRRELLQQAGSHMIFGRTYLAHSAARQLVGLAGVFVQRAQIISRPIEFAVRLFNLSFSDKQWQIINKKIKIEQENINRVA
ncbi:hypothetical protein [Pseudoalteromonas denitrificans]|uniref:Uncharacterized protein n=1 Tax=Pseudoalteromonas denitrificans DSM 6059 TaxID=1123010 RepID=A0A1I1NF73_9GAMM|nr:hypothetical protein [Pseudoalteromonas denitrificans]SFC95912.1 hypothetical protein SAMN02745724_03041 [Pseudoalteromonas denitrificans DSM 6059]